MNLRARGLKLPSAELSSYLVMAACSVGLAITVAARAMSFNNANGFEEDSMDKNKLAMVRNSVFSAIGDIGTAAIGGMLAA
jgi:hypothetical protein